MLTIRAILDFSGGKSIKQNLKKNKRRVKGWKEINNLNVADTIWVCACKKKQIRREETILFDLQPNQNVHFNLVLVYHAYLGKEYRNNRKLLVFGRLRKNFKEIRVHSFQLLNISPKCCILTLTTSPTCNFFHGIVSHFWSCNTSTGLLLIAISFWKRFCFT